MSSSDRTSVTDTSDLPFGYDQLSWAKRTVGIKTQDKMGSYLASKLTQKKSAAGEIGVIETRAYKEVAIEDKSEKETALQVLGRETFKEK